MSRLIKTKGGVLANIGGTLKTLEEMSPRELLSALSPTERAGLSKALKAEADAKAKAQREAATAKAAQSSAERAERAANAAAFKQVLATNARLFGAPSPATAAQPQRTSTKAGWDEARAEMLAMTGRG